ncbi:MAG: NAD(P)H-binding protein [Proteobacteria bacterium]|nr:NAD(P)H-binding protein [Pseudomonadota bacterium]
MAQELMDKLVVLVGGGGFLGRYVAQELLSRGARLRVVGPHAERAYGLKPLGNLGQFQLLHADVTKPETLPRVLGGADAVVNLAGTFGDDLAAVMGAGAGNLAQAARAARVAAFVQVSAIGADADGETAYARAKAAGEAAVHAALPGATVVRPGILFGADDHFINRFGSLASSLPVLPVFGPEARIQPLFVEDCARAIVAALADPERHGGKTFELAGPEVITMLDLNQRIAAAAERKPLLAPLPDGLSGLIATLTGWLPGAPITSQQWKLLKAGNTASGTLPGCAELGVQLHPLGLFLDRWMTRFRRNGRFADRLTA